MWAWCLRCFLGELGDKTFLLAVVFAAWCPWEGVRRSETSQFQQLMVFAGTTVALWARSLMLVTMADAQLWNGGFDLATCVALLLLIPKAHLDFVNTEDLDSKRREVVAAASRRSAGPSAMGGMFGIWGGSTSKDDDDDIEPESSFVAAYGTLAPPVSADGVFGERISDQLASTIISFVAPVLIIFSAEVDDKSEVVWLAAGGPQTRTDVIGALLGVSFAVSLAVFIGFVMERQMLDYRVAFLVIGIFSCVSLVSLSQGLLHLPVVEALAQAVPAEAVKAKAAAFLSLHGFALPAAARVDTGTNAAAAIASARGAL